MIAVIQRVSHASCEIEERQETKIKKGILILLGIEHRDNQEDVEWLSKKVVNMRIFSDEEGKMNLSCKDIGGEAMVISQFTLHASTKKGNRPSFIEAAKPDQAIPLYESFIQVLKKELKTVETGEFGAHMNISLCNDGPVTIIIDSKERK
jgi:D-tyrosyl-tRNA(Tyr) deacylase